MSILILVVLVAVGLVAASSLVCRSDVATTKAASAAWLGLALLTGIVGTGGALLAAGAIDHYFPAISAFAK